MATRSRDARRRSPARRRTVQAARHRLPLLLAAAALVATGWGLYSAGAPGQPPAPSASVVRTLRVDVLRELPHDTTAYTQGLLWWNGGLYESTGRYGESTLRRLNPETGAVEQRIDVPPAFFGEGLARVGDRLIMLTWMAERAFVFDLDTFEALRSFRYRGEGWGCATTGAGSS